MKKKSFGDMVYIKGFSVNIILSQEEREFLAASGWKIAGGLPKSALKKDVVDQIL